MSIPYETTAATDLAMIDASTIRQQGLTGRYAVYVDGVEVPLVERAFVAAGVVHYFELGPDSRPFLDPTQPDQPKRGIARGKVEIRRVVTSEGSGA